MYDRLAIAAGLTAVLFIVIELFLQSMYGGTLSEAILMIAWHGVVATASMSGGLAARPRNRAVLLAIAFLFSLPPTVAAGLPIIVTILVAVAGVRLMAGVPVGSGMMLAIGLLAGTFGLATPWIPAAGVLAWPLGSVVMAVGWHLRRRHGHDRGGWLMAMGVVVFAQPLVLLALSYALS